MGGGDMGGLTVRSGFRAGFGSPLPRHDPEGPRLWRGPWVWGRPWVAARDPGRFGMYIFLGLGSGPEFPTFPLFVLCFLRFPLGLRPVSESVFFRALPVDPRN